MFIGCSDYPQCDHTEVIDKPDETAITCPQCGQGKLLQRKSRYGKVFHSCDRYPECQFALNVKPVAGECAYCHYPLLMEKRTAKGPSCAVPASCAENPSRLQNNHIMNSELSPNLVSIIDALHQQQVIAYPTEAVFGLGCDPDSEQAVNALLALKQRPWEGADSDRRRLCAA